MCLNLDYMKTVQFIGIWKAAGGKDTHKQSVVKLWSKGELVGVISFGNLFFLMRMDFKPVKDQQKIYFTNESVSSDDIPLDAIPEWGNGNKKAISYTYICNVFSKSVAIH